MNGPLHEPLIDPTRLLFVGGLHRSGTTPFVRALGQHDEVSGLRGTDVSEDEGQHLQDVYPRIRVHGGMGRFARAPGAHLTEASPLVSPENARRLLDAWTPYWDLDRRVLAEKSPANMIMGRFLQALFPGSALVVVVRHPIVTALALAKWNPALIARNGRRRTTLEGRVEHWFLAHTLLREDLPLLSRTVVVRYEDLVEDPAREFSRVEDTLGLEGAVPAASLRADRSDSYREQWRAMARGTALQRRARHRIIERHAEAALSWGYDVETLRHTSLPAHPRETSVRRQP